MAKAETSAAPATGGRLRIRLVRSVIGNNARQRATVEGLGLRRLHQEVVHDDSPAIRGMVDKVRHLVQVVEE